MSAYLTLMTPMASQDALLDALADLGFGRDKVEVHASPVALVGYEASARAQQAEIVIRRQHVGSASNDLGFRQTPMGYQLIVSGYDQGRYGTPWLQQLNARYTHHAEQRRLRAEEAERRRQEEERRALVEAQKQAVYEKARAMGYKVEESRHGDAVRLVLVKRVYA